MSPTRVSDLAASQGISAAQVLEELRSLGCQLDFAWSLVPDEVVAQFSSRRRRRRPRGQRLSQAARAERRVRTADTTSELWPRPAPPPPPEPPRARTTWDDSMFAEGNRRVLWQRQGLLDHQAHVAEYLLSHGVLPEDLAIEVRGRKAGLRLRDGEAPHIIANEIHEERSRPARPILEVPTKAVRRRAVGERGLVAAGTYVQRESRLCSVRAQSLSSSSKMDGSFHRLNGTVQNKATGSSALEAS